MPCSTLEYVGLPAPWDRIITRGEHGTPAFTASRLDRGIPVAALTIDNWGAADHLRALIATAHRGNPRRLTDPDTPLPDLQPKEPSGRSIRRTIHSAGLEEAVSVVFAAVMVDEAGEQLDQVLPVGGG
ncbi:oxidoreductase C-terminal domain-containing protein [Nonomuraea sp. CA-141351]|uniref:oxidoreductase C-terminal domain-containing protein n=1 Tax=Nonomuraea sp. CA-141351 TaxID=3239996 RepID=UPI003D8A9BA6